jgi:hypothetical protein
VGGGVQPGPLGTAATDRPIVQPRVIMMMEKLVEWRSAGETKVLRGNLPQCLFVYHEPHMFCPDVNPGRRSGRPATNRLSYGTAAVQMFVCDKHNSGTNCVHMYWNLP